MSEIQRYDVVFRIDDDGERYRKVKDVNGPYVLYDAHRKLVAALKLAATQQATQAEAVLKERTRERDEALAELEEVKTAKMQFAQEAQAAFRSVGAERDALALSQGRLLGMLRDWRMNLYPRDHAKYCRASVKYRDWPDP